MYQLFWLLSSVISSAIDNVSPMGSLQIIKSDSLYSAQVMAYLIDNFSKTTVGIITESKFELKDCYCSGIITLGNPKLANTFFI